MVIVKLDENEVRQIKQFAWNIQKNKERTGNHRDLIDTTKDSLQTLISNFACEYALSKWLGLDYQFKLFVGGDDYDVIYNGRTIDVKHAVGAMYELKVQPKDLEKQPDLFVGAVKWIDKPIVELKGWIYYAAFKREAELQQRKYSEMYVIPVGRLEQMEFLKTI